MSGAATAAEQATARRWFTESFQAQATEINPLRFPVSFRYGDRESATLLKDWRAQWRTGASQPGATQQILAFTDPQTGLECRCEVTTFADFPAVEWVAYFKNTGTADTPIISDIQALDALFPLAKGQASRVHHAEGSECLYEGYGAKLSETQFDNFAPHETPLPAGASLRLGSIDGRSSHGSMPFFNLELGNGGVIGAVGWTGDWFATFQAGEDGPRVRAGMKETHLMLHPGEEIRTPRIALLFWEQDRLHGHNVWRRFILAHHTPRPNGELLLAPISDIAWGQCMTEDQLAKARWIKDNDLPVEVFWIDAGWYGDSPYEPGAQVENANWYNSVGSWYPHKQMYPNGFKPIGDLVKALGFAGFLLWFEPERAFEGSQLVKEHPEWLLGPRANSYLVNLGIPEARRYITDTISAVMNEGGINWYRQDFNFRPAAYWKAADAPDRVGMSEIRHIEGLYAFWDDLLARHPGLIIDNCASGGRRLDLEMTSRSIPLWRSDVQEAKDFDPVSMQTQTHGLSLWVPLSGTCCKGTNPYAFRSALGPGIVLDWSMRAIDWKENVPVELGRKLLREFREMRPYFYGDFYPLLPFNTTQGVWEAWQFDRPDLGEGLVLAFRRRGSPYRSLELPLHSLDAAATYEWRALDSGVVTQVSGRDLLEKGAAIEIGEKPGSALFVYKRVG